MGSCFMGETFPPEREKSDYHHCGKHLTYTNITKGAQARFALISRTAGAQVDSVPVPVSPWNKIKT